MMRHTLAPILLVLLLAPILLVLLPAPILLVLVLLLLLLLLLMMLLPLTLSLRRVLLLLMPLLARQVTGETNKVRFGGVNSRVNWDIPEKWGVTSYPWIASFYKGQKVEDMRGLSGAQSVVNFATEEMKKASPAGEEPRLRSKNHPPPGPQSMSAAKGGAGAAAAGEEAGAVAHDDGAPLQYGGENADRCV